jgi:hypothetical protein
MNCSETKTGKTPLVMAELFELSFCTSGLAPKSKLLRSPKVQYGFILKRSHHSGKNTVSLRFTEKAAHSNQNINLLDFLIEN